MHQPGYLASPHGPAGARPLHPLPDHVIQDHSGFSVQGPEAGRGEAPQKNYPHLFLSYPRAGYHNCTNFDYACP